MPTEVIRIDPADVSPGKIKYAAEALREGKLVVFPTETVYGIGAGAGNKKAMARLRNLKDRPKNPFSFHISSKRDFKKLGCIVDKTTKELINKFFPGPLTLVLNTNAGEKIGVRMPRHPVALALLKEARVNVVAPSANFKNELPATTARQAFWDLNGLVDIIIDSGKTNAGVSSTVLDLTHSPPRILRKGSVAKAALEKVIGKIAE